MRRHVTAPPPHVRSSTSENYRWISVQPFSSLQSNLKMVKLVLLLGCALAATAFSLIDRPVNNRIVGQSGTKLSQFSNALPIHNSPSFLKSAESAEIVAAEESKGPLSFIWNENTKIFFYLGVWYLGNIYCESSLVSQCSQTIDDFTE